MNKTIITLLLVGAGLLVVAGGYILVPTPKSSELMQSQLQGQINPPQFDTSLPLAPPTSPNETIPSPQPIFGTEETPTGTPAGSGMGQPTTHEVVYSNNGYSPTELIVKAGDTVVFKNQSSAGMWTASALHPSHTVYSGTSLQAHCPDASNVTFDECKSAQPGESWSFTFNKKGSWGYHNHVQAGHFGKIIVE
jgi:plastocyanin